MWHAMTKSENICTCITYTMSKKWKSKCGATIMLYTTCTF